MGREQAIEKNVTVKASINGVENEFEQGMSVLHAAQKLGFDIPTLCHDERVRACGACRVCLVEINGAPKPIASCSTEIADGMRVETDTSRVRDARVMNLKMLAQNYPLDAIKQFPEKPFHRLAKEYGLTDSDFLGKENGRRVDDSHPYIHVDMSRCVECYRCVRICREVTGQFVWQVVNRGQATEIVPDSGTTLKESTCISCGACVDTCPTGALEDKSVLERGTAVTWTKTVCPYCGTGCEMNVGVRDDRVVEVKAAMDSPVNRGHLCVKGRYAFDFMDAGDRVTTPMIRRAGGWEEVSWDEAIEFTANRMRVIHERNGPDSIAVLGSARATNEENYLAQKFARVVLGTNNVDCCARVCHTPTAAAMKMMLGTGAATNSYDDIEMASTILVCGANPTENHPIIGERIRQAVFQRGTNLIVIDPRKTELARIADIHLQNHPGTNIPLFNSIACVIVEEGLVDDAFIEDRVSDFEKFREFIKKFAPEVVAETCGVEAQNVRKAARMYATQKPSFACHGLGMTEHTQGTEGVMTIVNLALLTGNIGRRGAGVNPLRGQNNVQGSAHMGCDPGILTGSIAVDDGRELFENVWGAPVPHSKGLSAIAMLDSATKGDLKALWAIGYDVYFSMANAEATAKALGSLELLVVQDIFMNETAREFAHVFLPAVTSFEKDGTFMNAERRVSRVRKAVEPRGESRSDQEIICKVARAMGAGKHFQFETAEDVWNEIRQVWPGAYGITYPRIEKTGLQWGCPDEDHPGTEVLHADSFAHGPHANLRMINYRPTAETVSEEFPLLLNTGRTLFQFNAGTMTHRTRNAELMPTDFVCVSPADAKALQIDNGEDVVLRSRYGECVLPAAVTQQVKEGELFATFHSPQVFLNRVTSRQRDRFVHAPEYKVTAVRLEKSEPAE